MSVFKIAIWFLVAIMMIKTAYAGVWINKFNVVRNVAKTVHLFQVVIGMDIRVSVNKDFIYNSIPLPHNKHVCKLATPQWEKYMTKICIHVFLSARILLVHFGKKLIVCVQKDIQYNQNRILHTEKNVVKIAILLPIVIMILH